MISKPQGPSIPNPGFAWFCSPEKKFTGNWKCKCLRHSGYFVPLSNFGIMAQSFGSGKTLRIFPNRLFGTVQCRRRVKCLRPDRAKGNEGGSKGRPTGA